MRQRNSAPRFPLCSADRVRFVIWTVALTIARCLTVPLLASAQPFSVVRIVDTSNSIPGGSGNFVAFNLASLDNGSVAFLGLGSNGQSGIYTSVGGAISRVADTSTPIPGGTGTFTSTFSGPQGTSTAFLGPSLSNGSVAFIGFGSNNQSGIYTNVGGGLAGRRQSDPHSVRQRHFHRLHSKPRPVVVQRIGGLRRLRRQQSVGYLHECGGRLRGSPTRRPPFRPAAAPSPTSLGKRCPAGP